jgi:hypothetical protein
MNISFLDPTTILTSTTQPQSTISFSSTTIFTTTTRAATAHQRLLFTHTPWIYYNFSGSQLFTTTSKPAIKSATHPPIISSTTKANLPLPTPWYSPAGPFDWWQWQWYTTGSRQSSLKIDSTKQTTTRKTITTIRTTTTPRLTNKTTSIPTSTESKATVGWFKMQGTTSSLIKKDPSDSFEEEYKDWIEYSTADRIREKIITSTSTSSSSQQQYQQMDYLQTKSNWKIATIITPPAKRQHSQQNPVVSERNAVAIATNGKNTKKKDLFD